MSSDPNASVRWLPDAGNGWRRFELSSRGDRVVARLHARDGESPLPLAVVLADDAGGCVPIDGCATLALDLPLLGDRASPKWTERLRKCLAEGPSGAADRALLDDVSTQVAHDVSVALDVCAGLAGIGPRAGLLGLGFGAFAAARLAEHEPRLETFVLTPTGLATALDPLPALAAAGRPCAAASDPAEGMARIREALA